MWLMNFLRSLFGGRTQEQKVYTAAKIAGGLVALNNPAYVQLGSVGLEEIQQMIIRGDTTQTINMAFKLAIRKLTDNTGDAKTRAKILLVSSILNIDTATADVPTVSIPLISSAIKGFLEGMSL